MKLSSLFARRTIEGSVVNQYGEGVYLGHPTSVKHRKYEYTLTWDISKTPESVSPLDTLLIHEGIKIFQIIPVTKFWLSKDATTLTVRALT